MPKGRPTKSQIRQNMVDILYHLKKATGYDIYKAYKEIFPQVTLRVMYYHLKKGTQLEEFKLEKVETEKGEYSWGTQVQKIYYSLGPNAKPSKNEEVEKYFKK